MQRNDDTSGFTQPWTNFMAGFGDPAAATGNFWFGNECLHRLTQTGRYKIHLDLQALSAGTGYWAEYSTFHVDNESIQYTVHISGYNGAAGDSAVGDGVHETNGMKFTTTYRDNDLWAAGNCANHKGGGCWYYACGWVSINGAGPGSAPGFLWDTPTRHLSLNFSHVVLICH